MGHGLPVLAPYGLFRNDPIFAEKCTFIFYLTQVKKKVKMTDAMNAYVHCAMGVDVTRET